MHASTTARYITFCLTVRDLALLHNASVISWWRSHQHNTAVGGHPQSFHLQGIAADLEPDDPTKLPELARDARTLGLQVSLKAKAAHIELDFRNP